MGSVEVWTTLATALAATSLATYWSLVLAIDGNEGSFVTHPLVRGLCAPPFQLFGLGCREWIVTATSTTVWDIAILVVGAVLLALAARWRRTLLAVLASLLVMVVLFPSDLALVPACLIVMYGASAYNRLKRTSGWHP